MNWPAIVITCGFLLLVTACGGREAYPVQEKQVGDTKKSCEALEVELSAIEQKIQRLVPETKKTGKNVALGVTAVFLIVPAFFIDLSPAEKIEIEALQNRYTYLQTIMLEKECA